MENTTATVEEMEAKGYEVKGNKAYLFETEFEEGGTKKLMDLLEFKNGKWEKIPHGTYDW